MTKSKARNSLDGGGVGFRLVVRDDARVLVTEGPVKREVTDVTDALGVCCEEIMSFKFTKGVGSAEGNGMRALGCCPAFLLL